MNANSSSPHPPLLQRLLAPVAATLLGFLAAPQSAQADVLVSFQLPASLHEKDRGDKHTELCSRAFAEIKSILRENVTCVNIDPRAFRSTRLMELLQSGRFHTHLRYFVDDAGKLRASTHQVLKDDRTDFDNSEIRVAPEKGDFAGFVSAHSRQWARYRKDRYKIKAQLLASALPESKRLTSKDGETIQRTSDGRDLTWSQAYEEFVSESPRNEKYMRTALELGALLGFTGYLYVRYEPFAEDNDFNDGFWNSLRRKAKGEGWREDDNSSASNVGHVYAGAIYYEIARANGLSFMESTLVAMASSAYWELIPEYKEVFSINDMITTGWSGAIVGEVFHQMSVAVRKKSGSLPARLFATLINPTGAVIRKIDSWTEFESALARQPEPSFNFSRFDFSLLRGTSKTESAQAGSISSRYSGLRIEGEVSALKKDSAESDRMTGHREQKIFYEVPETKMLLELTKGRFGVEDFRFIAQALLVASQVRVRSVSSKSTDLMIGLSSGFDWSQKRSTPMFYEKSTSPDRDFWATTHIIGSTMRASGQYKGVDFNFEIQLHGDYALVKSYALENFEAAGGDLASTPTVIQKRGYYYGVGLHRAIKAEVANGPWSLGYSYSKSNLRDSGLKQRFDPMVDHRFKDDRSERALEARYSLGGELKNWELRVRRLQVNRGGSIDSQANTRSSERRTEVQLSYVW